MGYTHYWNFNAQTSDAEFIRRRFKSASSTVKRFAKFIKAQDMFKVRGGLGQGSPIINESEVWLNGDAATGEDHETFHLRWRDFLKRNGNRMDGFCKTAYKPYDLIVCFALLAFSEAFKSGFTFSSDGDKEDWKEAINLYETFTGKTAREPMQ